MCNVFSKLMGKMMILHISLKEGLNLMYYYKIILTHVCFLIRYIVNPTYFRKLKNLKLINIASF
jgi:hypothetical protein